MENIKTLSFPGREKFLSLSLPGMENILSVFLPRDGIILAVFNIQRRNCFMHGSTCFARLRSAPFLPGHKYYILQKKNDETNKKLIIIK